MSLSRLRCVWSGYSSRVLQRKPIALLQAYVDDSAQTGGERRLYWAAYINTAERWIDFSEAWERTLHEDPRIDFFTMKEAYLRSGQFEGFSEKKRNKKLFQLAEILKESKPWSFHISVNMKAHKTLFAPYAPFPMKDPHFLLAVGMILQISQMHKQFGLNEPTKMIFDQRDGLAAKLSPLFETIFQKEMSELRRFVAGVPSFEDDRDVIPLQASDFLAWHIRKNDTAIYPEEFSGILDTITVENAHLYVHIDDAALERMGNYFRDLPHASKIDRKAWEDIAAIIGGA